MIGNNSIPYRASCGGASNDYLMGSAYQHAIAAVIAAKFINETQMYAADGTTLVSPYARNYIDSACDNTCTTSCLSDIPDSIALNGITENTFTAAGTIDKTVCRERGFKALQAFKTWHGCFGFNVSPAGMDCSSPTTHPQKKYLTVTVNAAATSSGSFREYLTEDADPENILADITYSVSGGETLNFSSTVDADSGVMTVTKTISPASMGTLPFTESIFDNILGMETSSNQVSTMLVEYESALIQESIRVMESAYSANCGVYGLLYPAPASLDDYLWFGTPAEIAAQISGSLTGRRFVDLTLAELEFTETKLHVKITSSPKAPFSEATTHNGQPAHNYLEPLSSTSSLVFTVELSNENPAEDVMANVKAMLETVNHSDPTNSFRQDENVYVNPLVLRKEYPSPSDPRSGTDGFTDPHAADYDGSIIPALNPLGYGEPGGTGRGTFDFQADVFMKAFCYDEWQIGLVYKGEWTPDFLPPNVNKWTVSNWLNDAASDTGIFPGSFVWFNSTGVLIQKSIEVIERRPSYNFARPYGRDRFLIDETSVYFVDSGTIYDQSLAVAADAVLAGIWGGTSVGGFYSGCSITSGVLTLGPKVYDVPSWWTLPSGDESFAFGKLRFTTAPGFGGRVRVAASYDSESGMTTLTYPARDAILSGDLVDLLLADSTWEPGLEITVISATSATVAGDYSTAKWMVPHLLFDGTTSGQKWYFANDSAKGDYVWREWSIVAGVATLTSQTQACLPFTPCSAQIVGAAAGSEVSADYGNGEIYSIPNIANGGIWIGEVGQWMADPLWQAPHRPYNHEGTWAMDSGDCTGDYPMPPFVECRIAAATGYGPAQNDTAPAPAVAFSAPAAPPAQASTMMIEGKLTDIIYPYVCPWGVSLRQESCVCANGSYAYNYAQNAVWCPQ